jgi:hypothetical protein
MYWLITTIAFTGYTPDISKITVEDYDSCIKSLESAVIRQPSSLEDGDTSVVIYSCVKKNNL